MARLDAASASAHLGPMAEEAFLSRPFAEKRVGRSLSNKWTLDSLIDIGGMAAVYAATHRNGMRVAIKIMHPSFARDPNIRERFMREGYLANKVGHPLAVSVLDDDVTDDGLVFLVMELLEGQTLEGFLTQSGGRIAAPHVLAITDQLLDLLSAAHPKQIVHRDLKPANLFLTWNGLVKVLDFGLARLKDANPKNALTATGTVMGTASYMSPEQARAQWNLVDARSDLFSVGAVMFRSLAARFIHDAQSPMDRLLAAMKQPVPPLASVLPDIDPRVASIVDKALAFSPADRWQDARSMQNAVRDAIRAVPAHQGVSRTASAPVQGPTQMITPYEVEVISIELEDDFPPVPTSLTTSQSSILGTPDLISIDTDIPSFFETSSTVLILDMLSAHGSPMPETKR